MEQPIYQQIIERLKQEIKTLSPNDPISSERELAEYFNASRMTVRKAIRKLVEQGYLYRNGNLGTFVADQKLHKKGALIEMSDYVDTGDSHRILYFDVKSNIEDIHEKLEIDREDQFIRVVRLNLQDKTPESIDEIYMVRKMVDDNDMNNIAKLLEFQNNTHVGSIKQTFIPSIIPVQYATLLKLALNTPIIIVETIIYTKKAKVYTFIRSFFNPEVKKLEIIT